MKGKLAQVIVTAEPGYVFLGTAPLNKRTIGSYAFPVEEVQYIILALEQAVKKANEVKQ